MSEELRPCGFCGHDEARVIVVDEVTDAGCDEATVPLYAASCPYCGACGPMALSKGEAIDAWNRRAERTCQIVVSIDRSPASYGGRVHRCSSCGKALPGALFRNGWTQLDYCPRCGARVTEVVRDGD